jgi:4-amino-4-deoxychorismate lyase
MAGVFETIRVRDGQIPFLERHLARLREGCDALDAGRADDGLAARIHGAIKAPEMVIRVTIEDGEERIETRAAPPAQPMRIVFSGTQHEAYPYKSTDRAVFDRARARVVPYRADEAILLGQDGVLAEGCITSVFFWLGATLCTPSLDLGILPGVGRARLIELARSLKISVQEGRFTMAETQGLPLFLVNSVRGIIETTRHGDRHSPVGDDRTRKLADRFWAEAPVETGPSRV